jgi:hypothetical protein
MAGWMGLKPYAGGMHALWRLVRMFVGLGLRRRMVGVGVVRYVDVGVYVKHEESSLSLIHWES